MCTLQFFSGVKKRKEENYKRNFFTYLPWLLFIERNMILQLLLKIQNTIKLHLLRNRLYETNFISQLKMN